MHIRKKIEFYHTGKGEDYDRIARKQNKYTHVLEDFCSPHYIAMQSFLLEHFERYCSDLL